MYGTIIPLIWFLLVFLFPIAFLVTAYISYIDEVKPSEIILKLSIAFVGYIFMTAITIPFMFVLVYAGAHSHSTGNSLELKGKIVYLSIIFAYAIIGWLLCSFVNGNLINPWGIFNRNNKETQSLLDDK